MSSISMMTSSTLTTAARENVPTRITEPSPHQFECSRSICGGTLRAHTELPKSGHFEGQAPAVAPSPSHHRPPITPSLATLEKAVSARIYFENLYYPLLRQPSSREQRKVAMERAMISMNLGEDEKEVLRAQWRQNETDYLRERRRKVDATAFIKLKTIGHGICLLQKESALHLSQPYRCIWSSIVSQRTQHGTAVCDEAGVCLCFYFIYLLLNFYPTMNSYARRTCYEKGKKVTSVLNAIFSSLRLWFLPADQNGS